jgi:hypothetical protein
MNAFGSKATSHKIVYISLALFGKNEEREKEKERRREGGY